ncbi:MAG: helix-turn-helix domain-containing protein [Azoarcus sp.]|nr:helix-turn-helix domain-containing protein [Azoarcus sp.]
MNTTTVATRIAELLQAKNGGNQSELARYVGVSPQAVQQWVAGETTPRGKNLVKLADFFSITPSEIQFGVVRAPMDVAAEEHVAQLLEADGWQVERMSAHDAPDLPPVFHGDDYQYIPDLRIKKNDSELFVEVTSRKFARMPAMMKLAADSGRLVLVDWEKPEEAITKANALLKSGARAPLVKKYQDSIVIPVLDVAGSMGHGAMMPDHEEPIERMTVTAAWIRRNISVSRPSNLALITGYGDSMQGTFDDGDLLLVDRGVTDIKIDGVFVLALNDQLYIKRLQRRPNGSVLMISDNRKYEPYLIENGERDKFQVLGRVVLAWNAKKV